MDPIQSIIRSYFEIAGIFGIVGFVFALALPVFLVACVLLVFSALFGSSPDKEYAKETIRDWAGTVSDFIRMPFALAAEGWAYLRDKAKPGAD